MRQLAAIVALPFMVAVLIPTWILLSSGSADIGWGLPSPLHWLPITIALFLLGAGLFLVVVTVRLFATVGQGTLAPWDAPQHLVVNGIYRHLRNPMISGVITILLGETVLFGSLPLLYWVIFVTLINLIYIPLLEEPGLHDRFGHKYDEYVRNVPRWLPRRTPWQPPAHPNR